MADRRKKPAVESGDECCRHARSAPPNMPHTLLEAGILLASLSAVALNLFFNGGRADQRAAIEAARTADAH